MYEVQDKDTMKYEILPPICLWQNVAMFQKATLAEVIPYVLYTLRAWLPMADYFCVCMMLLPLSVSSMPCNRSRWSLQTYMFSVPLPTCACLPYVGFVWFMVRDLTLWVSFSSTNAHLAAKNRFSRKFVLMQNRVSMCMRQNEYLFKRTAICTTFGAIYG